MGTGGTIQDPGTNEWIRTVGSKHVKRFTRTQVRTALELYSIPSL